MCTCIRGADARWIDGGANGAAAVVRWRLRSPPYDLSRASKSDNQNDLDGSKATSRDA